MRAIQVLFAFLPLAARTAAAQPGMVLPGALAAGDDVCANLCDRYGLSWDSGGSVRVELVTDGFGAKLSARRSEGGWTPPPATQLQLVVRPGEQIALEVEEITPASGGQYLLRIQPAPSRYRLPPGAAAPAPPSPRPPPALQPTAQRPATDPARETALRLMRGFQPSSPLFIGRLEQVPPLEFPARRGQCYRSVVILAPGARRRPASPTAPAPAALVRMTLRARRVLEAVNESVRSTDRVIAIDDDLCPSENGTLDIAFLDRTTAAAVSSPGIGPFTVQLFERPAPTR
ncbi:MAG: hypothetical protein HYY06_30335 [Deltaproteobacteria bacterium]|nr:hypothetical protein [Deltaproteobacteria bacterium]